MFKVEVPSWADAGSKNLTDAAAPLTSSILVRQRWLCESPNAQNSHEDIL